MRLKRAWWIDRFLGPAWFKGGRELPATRLSLFDFHRRLPPLANSASARECASLKGPEDFASSSSRDAPRPAQVAHRAPATPPCARFLGSRPGRHGRRAARRRRRRGEGLVPCARSPTPTVRSRDATLRRSRKLRDEFEQDAPRRSARVVVRRRGAVRPTQCRGLLRLGARGRRARARRLGQNQRRQ